MLEQPNQPFPFLRAEAHLTVAVVLQVKKLIGPLGDDTKSIFEEGDDDQETANGREIAVNRDKGQLSELQTRLQRTSLDSRLDRLADGVERILNLAGIGSNLLEKALTLLRIDGLGSAIRRGATEAITRVESLGHGCRVDVRFRRRLVSRADLLTRWMMLMMKKQDNVEEKRFPISGRREEEKRKRRSNSWLVKLSGV
jgi:hypothetical protein